MGGSGRGPIWGAWALALAAALALPTAMADAGWRTRIDAPLASLHDRALRGTAVQASQAMRIRDDGRVQTDVWYDCRGAAPLPGLVAAGLSISNAVHLAGFCVVEGWVVPDQLPALTEVDGVNRVALPSYAIRRPPRSAPGESSVRLEQAQAANDNGIDRNGVTIMRADQFVTQSHVNGSGVTVGVQSAGIASINLIEARGELPAVHVVDPAGGSSSALQADEGTILMEEVHAVAPGATLVYCGPTTFVDYTSCLGQLIAAGATVLADDVAFPANDLLASDSPQAQAVSQIAAGHPEVMLFTAAGNYNGSYWQGPYSPVAAASQGIGPLSCSALSPAQSDLYVTSFSGTNQQQLTVLESGTFPVNLTWSDPPGKNASQFDLYWFDAGTGHQVGCFSGSGGTDSQIAKYLALNAGTYRIYIATPDAAAAGKFLKLWVGGDGLTTLSISSSGSIVTPQAFASGVISVGAVNGSDGTGDHIETFSSLGPITVDFPNSAQIQAPTLVAPDGINVDAIGTYFSSDLFPDGNFYGTSASVPNAAAVAALIRSAFPQLNAAQVLSVLEKGATQLASTVPDPAFGYGRIDAQGALATIPAPTMSSLPNTTLNAAASSATFPFAVTGTGPLHFTVSSSDPGIIPSALVGSGSPGVTIMPAGCGLSTLSCSLVVTAGHGPGGSIKVTVAAVDGAGRSAPSTMTVTVNGDQAPAPSTPPVTSAGGGGALSCWELALMLAILVRCSGAACRGVMRINRPSRGRSLHRG